MAHVPGRRTCTLCWVRGQGHQFPPPDHRPGLRGLVGDACLRRPPSRAGSSADAPEGPPSTGMVLLSVAEAVCQRRGLRRTRPRRRPEYSLYREETGGFSIYDDFCIDEITSSSEESPRVTFRQYHHSPPHKSIYDIPVALANFITFRSWLASMDLACSVRPFPSLLLVPTVQPALHEIACLYGSVGVLASVEYESTTVDRAFSDIFLFRIGLDTTLRRKDLARLTNRISSCVAKRHDNWPRII